MKRTEPAAGALHGDRDPRHRCERCHGRTGWGAGLGQCVGAAQEQRRKRRAKDRYGLHARNPGLRPGPLHQVFKSRLVTIRTTAAAFIGRTPAMITPYRITQIQVARIGGRADDGTANRANSRA